MNISSPLQGVQGWVAHRLLGNYWSLPVLSVLVAPAFALGVLWLDRNGLTQFLLAHGLSPVSTADTARDFAGVASGINAAFVSLYFSITLIVLSLAASNLGVRLIDRWLTKRLVRVSLSGLSFSLVVSLIAMLSIDADAALADTPLGLVAAVMLLQIVNVAMLAVSLHDLGRTMFVDTSIDQLSNDAKAVPVPVVAGEAHEGEWQQVLHAERDGYVEGNDLERARKLLQDHEGKVRFCAAPGQHILKDQPIIALEQPFGRADALLACVPLGGFRSDSQGVVFQVRLLVEIAARALSPAVNDFYTALASADNLAAAMSRHSDSWVPDGAAVCYAKEPRFELPGQDFRGLFEDPMNAFRQAACQYPSVSIRMIGNYARLTRQLHDRVEGRGLGSFLLTLSQELSEHAAAVTQYESDRNDIRDAFNAHRQEWDELQNGRRVQAL